MTEDRAVVLGGGGVTGISWEVGVVHGLREYGVDPLAADLFVGTSAGTLAGRVREARWDPGPSCPALTSMF
jgi:predicted acylesterase/phospholipase RssA